MAKATHDIRTIATTAIPTGWSMAALKDVTAPRGLRMKPSEMKDAPFIGLKHVESDTMRLLGVGQTNDVKSSGSYFASGDILYGRLRPYLNKVYQPNFEGLASGEFIIFPNRPSLNNQYLQYFLNRWEFVASVTRLNTGDRPRVDFDQFADHPIPLPPLPEQRRIVAEIEKQFTRLDASAAALKRVQANLKRYRASVLKSACEGNLVPTEAEIAHSEDRDYEPADRLLERILSERRARWESQEKRRGKYKEPVAPDTTNLPELPEGWVWSTVAQLLVEPLANGRSVKTASDGFPVLRLTALQEGELNQNEYKVGSWTAEQAEPFLIQKGDFFVSRGNGSLRLVGIGGLVREVQAPVAFPDTMIRLRLIGLVLDSYFSRVWNSTLVRVQIEQCAKTTAGIHKVNQQDLSICLIPLPPLAEQRRIVAEVERRLSVVQQAEAAVEANLTRAERLRQSILKQAFSGKLVPQDPNDEPASVLLEQIRAEREAAEEAAKAQRRPRRRRSNSSPANRPKVSEAAS